MMYSAQRKSSSLKKVLPAGRQGFTLIELLVVIGILAVLLAIVLVAINPARQFSQANNTQRRSDVNAILNAVHQYAADNGGNLPAGIGTTTRTITSSTTGDVVDLCAALVPLYIADLPLDPKEGTELPANSVCTESGATYDTQYTIVRSASDNRITVDAPDVELNEVIIVTR